MADNRPPWETLLGNPDVHLDGEAEAVDLIRRWVFPDLKPVLPADEFTWLSKPEPST